MERKQLEFGDDPSMDITIHENGDLYFEINNDLYGDTVSGFGATLGYSLTREQVKQLIEFLVANYL